MDVLVLLPLNDEQKARLEAGAPGAHFEYATADDATSAQLAGADAIVGNLPPARLAETTCLRLLQLNSAGFDNYAAAGTLPAGAALCTASGAYGQAVSEHMLAMVMAMMKRLPAYRDDQRAHAWSDHGTVASFVGSKVLVLGAGDIGTNFARLTCALGATAVGVRRHAATPGAGSPFESIHAMDELPELLASADVVASFLPSAPQTRGLANAAFFQAMKPGSYFANAGRGDLVINEALINALASGHLAGAALDVCDPEPLPADDPLWDAPGVFITPHVSGWFHLPATLDRIVDIAAQNLANLEAGGELRNRVL